MQRHDTRREARGDEDTPREPVPTDGFNPLSSEWSAKEAGPGGTPAPLERRGPKGEVPPGLAESPGGSLSPTGRIVGDARRTLSLIPDGGAGLIVTDPPWDLVGGGVFDACASYPRLSVAEIAAILSDARRCLVKGGHLYVFGPAGPEFARIPNAFEAHGWRFLRVLAWDKAAHCGMGAYRNSWEPIFIFSNGPTRGFNQRQTYSSLLRARSIARRTAKPWELYEVFMEMSSKPGELVVDPFCGTNPLEKAASRLRPRRRWLAGDVLSAQEVEYQVTHRSRGKRARASDPTPEPDAPGVNA